MSDAAPKKWVKALRLKSTPWRVLVGLWGHARYTADGPAFVFPTRNTLAEEVGLTLGTLRNGLDALAALGWVRRERNGWKLAWMSPGAFDRPADGPARPTDGPAHQQAAPAHGWATPARPQADPRPTGGPHNFKGTSNSTSNELEVERATPTPSVKPAESGVLDPPPNYPAHVQAHLARVTKTAPTPADGKLPIDVFKAIEAHDNGAWSVSVASLTWADACADTMDGDNLDLAHVLRLLDAWTAEARPTRQPSQPSKKVIWYTYGDQGRRARAWVERAMESTRATLRVVGGPSAYELELEEMRR